MFTLIPNLLVCLFLSWKRIVYMLTTTSVIYITGNTPSPRNSQGKSSVTPPTDNPVCRSLGSYSICDLTRFCAIQDGRAWLSQGWVGKLGGVVTPACFWMTVVTLGDAEFKRGKILDACTSPCCKLTFGKLAYGGSALLSRGVFSWMVALYKHLLTNLPPPWANYLIVNIEQEDRNAVLHLT